MDQQQIGTRLAVAEAMAAELPGFLRAGSLYQPMRVDTPGGSEAPVMTLGALLENVEALKAERASLSPEQRSRLDEVEQKVDHDRRALPEEWRSHLRRELKAQMDSWKWYLDDAVQSPKARENYATEAHARTRIQLLMHALAGDPEIDAERERLTKMDARLRGIFRPGEYVGPRGAESRYPPGDAWWLYGRPGT